MDNDARASSDIVARRPAAIDAASPWRRSTQGNAAREHADLPAEVLRVLAQRAVAAVRARQPLRLRQSLRCRARLACGHGPVGAAVGPEGRCLDGRERRFHRWATNACDPVGARSGGGTVGAAADGERGEIVLGPADVHALTRGSQKRGAAFDRARPEACGHVPRDAATAASPMRNEAFA